MRPRTVIADSGSIRVLSTDLANKIAAGEVIERPASVVKELVENAIDAGATRIEVEIRDAGKEYIRVTDNGRGIHREEIPLAFFRHATNKILSFEDLANVMSLGFRGEALPSIASCAEVEMTSSTGGNAAARMVVTGGLAGAVETCAGPPGTTVVVRRLFFNTPARYKFLKQPATERRHITEYVSNMALAHPDIAFRLLAETGLLLATKGNGDLLGAIAAIYGAQLGRQMIPVQWEGPFVSVSGYISPPGETRPNRSHEALFVNGRWVQNRLLYAAVEKGYDNMLGTRRFPVAVLHLSTDPSLLDVNVHPAKTEIRFRDESETFKSIMLAVRRGLTGADIAPRLNATDGSQHSIPRSPTTFVSHEMPYKVAEAGGCASIPLDTNPRSALPSIPASLAERIDGARTQEEMSREAGALREFLRRTHPLGQVLDTYIVIPSPYGLWLVDQHAAHERVLYEEILARSEESVSQMLIAPLPIRLSPSEVTMLEEHKEALAELGFILERFGTGSCLVRGVPVQLSETPDESILHELLVEVTETWSTSGPSHRQEAAMMVACRAAVKAGRRLDLSAQRALLANLSEVDNPFCCPHGRPLIIAIDREELERRFGRR